MGLLKREIGHSIKGAIEGRDYHLQEEKPVYSTWNLGGVQSRRQLRYNEGKIQREQNSFHNWTRPRNVVFLEDISFSKKDCMPLLFKDCAMITAFIWVYLGIYILWVFVFVFVLKGFLFFLPFFRIRLASAFFIFKKKVTFPSTHQLGTKTSLAVPFEASHCFLYKEQSVVTRDLLFFFFFFLSSFSRQRHDVQAVARQGHGKGALCF